MSKTDHVGVPFQFRAAGGPCCTTTQHGADRLDFSRLCARCKRRAEDAGFRPHTAATPARAAAKPAPKIVMRAAVGSDGRTDQERREDRELCAGLRKLGVDRLREPEAPARTRTARRGSIYAVPGGYSAALGRPISRPRGLAEVLPEPTDQERAEDREDDREVDRLVSIISAALPFVTADELLGVDRGTLESWAARIEARADEGDMEAIEDGVLSALSRSPRGITRALRAKRTAADKAKARAVREIDRYGREEAGAQPWTRALLRRQAVRDIDAGREPLTDVEIKRRDPAEVPKPYDEALKRRREVAA